MDQGLVPNRYAKALYKFATEKGQAQRVYELMKHLAATFAGEQNLQQVIANPFVPVEDKTKLLITAACADSKTDTCFVDFLRLLQDNNRIDLIRQMALSYETLYRRENNIYKVNIVTAAQLPADEIKRLHDLVEKHLNGASMEFTQSIDPVLIGGFVININSERLDASVSNELKQLRLQLLSN